MPSSHITADYEAIIVNYTLHAVRSESRSHVADFTRKYARALSITPGNISRDALRSTLNCVPKLTAWVWVGYGVVTVKTVFHPGITGNYFLAGNGAKLSSSIAGTQCSLLCCMAGVTNDDRNFNYQHPISYESTLEPYDSYACDRMWDWVESQPTTARHRNSTTMLALTLGAGLRAREICMLRGKDVRVNDGGALLFPYGYRGTGPREASLFKFHVEILQPVIITIGPGDCLFRPSRDNENVSQFPAHLHWVTPNTLPDAVPSIHRPRNTWIVGRIAAGVPADVPCAMAGLKSLYQFEDYAVETGVNRRHAYWTLLVGGSTHGTPGEDLYALQLGSRKLPELSLTIVDT